MGEVIALRRPRRAPPRECRIPLSAELVAVVRFGVDHPGAVGPRFWAAVEEAVADRVFGDVPASARGLVLELDADRLEVRARWSGQERPTAAGAR